MRQQLARNYHPAPPGVYIRGNYGPLYDRYPATNYPGQAHLAKVRRITDNYNMLAELRGISDRCPFLK